MNLHAYTHKQTNTHTYYPSKGTQMRLSVAVISSLSDFRVRSVEKLTESDTFYVTSSLQKLFANIISNVTRCNSSPAFGTENTIQALHRLSEVCKSSSSCDAAYLAVFPLRLDKETNKEGKIYRGIVEQVKKYSSPGQKLPRDRCIITITQLSMFDLANRVLHPIKV